MRDSEPKPESDAVRHPEREAKPELEPGAVQAVEVLKEVMAVAGPEALAHLVEPNVILTLGGVRGQTELPIIDPTDADREQVTLLSKILQDRGLYFSAEESENPYSKVNFLSVSIVNLPALAEAAEHTSIPGIAHLDSSRGMAGANDWFQQSLAGCQKAQEEGRLPDEIDELAHVVVGVAKGYPDKAVIGFNQLLDHANEADSVVSTDIPYANMYDPAQPNYSYLKEDAEDPEIVEHQQLWGGVLKSFYESDFHKQLVERPEFKRARAAVDAAGAHERNA